MCLSAAVLVAGFETVTSLISNTVRTLAGNPIRCVRYAARRPDPGGTTPSSRRRIRRA
jgi:cytochrome P450